MIYQHLIHIHISTELNNKGISLRPRSQLFDYQWPYIERGLITAQNCIIRISTNIYIHTTLTYMSL